MKNLSTGEYLTPQIVEVNMLTEQVFAASGLFEADHDGFGYYDEEANN